MYPILDIVKVMRVGRRAKKPEDLIRDLKEKNPPDESDRSLLKKCVGAWLMFNCTG